MDDCRSRRTTRNSMLEPPLEGLLSRRTALDETMACSRFRTSSNASRVVADDARLVNQGRPAAADGGVRGDLRVGLGSTVRHSSITPAARRRRQTEAAAHVLHGLGPPYAGSGTIPAARSRCIPHARGVAEIWTRRDHCCESARHVPYTTALQHHDTTPPADAR